MADKRLQPVRLDPLDERPLVSVLVPLYNYAAYLPQALASVLAQTYEHFEVIICDDGSTDGSLEVARQFAARDPRLRVIHKPNGGQASALNAAYAAASGDILCILDPDDIFRERKLERVVSQCRDNPECGLIVHSMTLIDKDCKPSETIPFLGRFEQGWLGEKLIERGGRWRFMPSSALCFRREAGACSLPIPEAEFRGNADAFLFTILPLFTSVCYINEPLALYRVHDANMSGDFAVTLKSLKYWDHCLKTPISTVNHRLRELGYAEQLNIEKNLNDAILRFKIKALEGEPIRNLCRSYLTLLKLVIRDEVYGPFDKALVIMSHGLAIFLGVSARQWLFNRFASPNPVKRRLQKLVSSFKAADSGALWNRST